MRARRLDVLTISRAVGVTALLYLTRRVLSREVPSTLFYSLTFIRLSAPVR